MVPSSRTALNTSPKPPVPMRLSFEKLLVAFVISLPVKILDDFPVDFALSISCRSLTMFLWISFLTLLWLCLFARTANAIASVTTTTTTAAPAKTTVLFFFFLQRFPWRHLPPKNTGASFQAETSRVRQAL